MSGTKTHWTRTSTNKWAFTTYSPNINNGNVFYVGSDVSGATDGAGYGQFPELPFATINYAITQCTATNDDLIIVLPGHTETITSAGGVALSKAGVTIRGDGVGRARPKINYTTAIGASFDITAANCKLINLVFTPIGFDAITAAVNVQAADTTFENCEFQLADATNQAVLGILTNASADRMVLNKCYFYGTSDAGTTAAVKIVGGDSIKIKECEFQGAYSSGVGAIQQTTTATTNLLVDRCIINNLTASCTKAMVFTATSTGMLSNNRMQILSGSTPITGAALSWLNNTFSNTIATDGGGSTLVASAIDVATFTTNATANLVKGKVVTKSAANLPATAYGALFTVTGGKVAITSIVGEVVTAIQNQACTIKFTATPTVGTANDLSAASTSMAAAETGALLSMTGLASDAATGGPAKSGGVQAQAYPVVVNTGTVGITTSATNTGTMKWVVTYIPIDAGATVA